MEHDFLPGDFCLYDSQPDKKFTFMVLGRSLNEGCCYAVLYYDGSVDRHLTSEWFLNGSPIKIDKVIQRLV